MLALLRFRELGSAPPDGFPLQPSVLHMRAGVVALSPHFEVRSAHRAGVRALDIESAHGRFMLAGDAEGLLAVYDVRLPFGACARAGKTSGPPNVVKPVARVPKAHKYAIAAVCWYPPDPGLFLTAAYDGLVRAWDADMLQPALDFEMHGRTYALHLSPVATSHGLVAVGSEESAVRLCDLRSGAHTHLLHGHTAPVWAVRWSTAHEHVLASGSQDGRALVWDVRRPGALHVLDRSSAPAARQRGDAGGSGSGDGCPSGAARDAQRRRTSAHDGGVNGLVFSPDGSELLTFGKDDRLRAWDVTTGRFIRTHYEGAANAAPRNVVMAASACGGIGTAHAHAYVPCGRLLHVYEWATGRLRARLRGHFERVNAVALADGGAVGSGPSEALFTASDDHSICAWAPPADSLGAATAPVAGTGAGAKAGRAAGARAQARPAGGRAGERAHAAPDGPSGGVRLGRSQHAAAAAAAAVAVGPSDARRSAPVSGQRRRRDWEEEGPEARASTMSAALAAAQADVQADAWSDEEEGG